MISFKEFLAEIRASHVTIHDFDKFSLEKMKSGEGFHDFGWGIYFTENRGVVQFYRTTLPRGNTGAFIVKADLPNESELLYWDGDFSVQPSRVKSAINKLSAQHGIPVGGIEDYYHHRSESGTAGHFYTSLGNKLGSDKSASKAFDRLGIPGLRYLDAGSRGKSAGSRTFNYVIWNAERMNVIYRHQRHISK